MYGAASGSCSGLNCANNERDSQSRDGRDKKEYFQSAWRAQMTIKRPERKD
jgi:hypothetical protein